MRRRLAAVAVVSAVALAAGGPGGAPASPTASASVDTYEGLGTWIDVYDRSVWAAPERAVEAMSARGVSTLFLQTSNYRLRQDVVRPALVRRFITAAHDNGLSVVAWYLPSLVDLGGDYRRALRAIRFRTADGDAFDSFALDIEARVVGSPWTRSARLLRLATAIRRSVDAAYPLGAIVPSTRRMRLDPGYWPGFPFRGLARSFDVFLPMTYFAHGRRINVARADTLADVAAIRRGTGDPAVPIHVIGGIAGVASVAEVSAFARATADCGALGASLYDFAETRAEQWAVLAGVTFATGGPPVRCS